ncbi:hypothetical protein JG550_003414 [Curtobacterium flaccumfaciens pv. flaccumfaciens]|uniref:hypothetical protein n=1 Tax=Curtobacterium flaccumfaciens TaxID=2035 RepID=UPI001ADAE3E6|nr:hypothetical protein [Curtobacterium flaccumfaciens]MBO9046200.1 hypothetical protein [Curtobacterium flaccumfaciens pv. flaccumfaciens]QTR90653.1 hypothetical protein JG550_003414 [Curtobacterium flaccumfaciens pv. flaccumfaciens]
MSMSAPFDPEQQGRSIPVDGSDESELEMEEDRGADVGDDSADPSVAPVSHHDEDEAGGGPVFRRPHAGDRLHPDDLAG